MASASDSSVPTFGAGYGMAFTGDNGGPGDDEEEEETGKGEELSETDILFLAMELGRAPSGQEVIDFISSIHSKYPEAFVLGETLKKSVPGITNDAKESLGNINYIQKMGTEIVIHGETDIKILPGFLNLNISDRAAFNIQTLNSDRAVIGISGIRVGWFNLNSATITSNSVIVNIGGYNQTWELE